MVEIGVKKKFRGLSTETKPTTGLSVGDEWINTDTGEVFVWDGSKWQTAGGTLTPLSIISLVGAD